MNKLANNDFEFLLCEIKSIFLKNKVLKYLIKNNNNETEDIINFLKKSKKLPIFPYSFVEKYDLKVHNIKKDGKYLYTDFENNKLYFSVKYRNKFRAQRYLNNLLIEQDTESPHRYLSPNIDLNSNEIIFFDIGGAEGLISLQLINKVKKIYIFECNEKWINALNKTFEKYKDKVEIINKYVTNKIDEHNITIDEFIKQKGLENEKILIKMDIEGCEEQALTGAQKTIERVEDIDWLICTYHLQESERIVRDFFKNYNIETSKGYMFYYYDYSFKEPYLRRGVIRAF